MAILVDEARWAWQGRRWCHLVSDHSYDELHTFAADLGCRRVGFQGDHYDIDAHRRQQALASGALAIDSRELVRRIKASSLRVRPSSFSKWQLVERGAGALPDAWWSMVPNTLGLASVGLDELRCAAERWFVLRRESGDAVVLVGTDPTMAQSLARERSVESAHPGVFVRVDADSEWSLEWIDPAPLPHQ